MLALNLVCVHASYNEALVISFTLFFGDCMHNYWISFNLIKARNDDVMVWVLSLSGGQSNLGSSGGNQSCNPSHLVMILFCSAQ
jgi:hypothetical protein